jgi:hypothetical protein
VPESDKVLEARRASSRAIGRALTKLSHEHPDEYRRLLEVEKAREGIKRLVPRGHAS